MRSKRSMTKTKVRLVSGADGSKTWKAWREGMGGVCAYGTASKGNDGRWYAETPNRPGRSFVGLNATVAARRALKAIAREKTHLTYA